MEYFYANKNGFFNEALAISQDSNHIHSATIWNFEKFGFWVFGIVQHGFLFSPKSTTIGTINHNRMPYIESNENMCYIDRLTGSHRFGTIEQNGLEFQISQHQSLLIATKRHFWREYSKRQQCDENASKLIMHESWKIFEFSTLWTAIIMKISISIFICKIRAFLNQIH